MRATEIMTLSEVVDTDPLRAFCVNLEQELKLGIFDAEMRHGDLHLSIIVVPRSLRNQGVGSEAIRCLCAYADQHGLRITLSPAQRGGVHGSTSSARLTAFYKRFGFVENKGRNKDYAISDAMFRNPKD